MQLNSTVKPVYLPLLDQTPVLQLGLHPLTVADWIQPDTDFEQFHAHKLEQCSTGKDRVTSALECASPAITEFNDYLLQHLLRDRCETYTRKADRLLHIPSALAFDLPAQSLWESSLWIQEDVCLLQNMGGNYILTAASLCSPSNWSLQEKMGATVDMIHAPVPGYESTLSTRVNKLLNGLKPDKPLMRYNWSVQRGNELNWHSETHNKASEEEVYWRVERQTLIKLPKTDSIAFTIRIYLHPFSQLMDLPEFHSNLETIVSRLSPQLIDYKELGFLLK